MIETIDSRIGIAYQVPTAISCSTASRGFVCLKICGPAAAESKSTLETNEAQLR